MHGTATKLEPNHVTYTPASYTHNSSNGNQTIEFDYLVYALGATLPGPIDFWGAKNVYEKEINLEVEKARTGFNGSKPAAIDFLQRAQARLKEVESVLVVGGGALGIRTFFFLNSGLLWLIRVIEFATDLKDVYHQKQITLLHSRMQLLPRFPEKMHGESAFLAFSHPITYS